MSFLIFPVHTEVLIAGVINDLNRSKLLMHQFGQTIISGRPVDPNQVICLEVARTVYTTIVIVSLPG